MADSTDALTTATDSRYASRKFILAALVLLAAGAARVLGLLSPELTVDLLKWTLGLYFTGNVIAGAVPPLAALFTPKAST